jgi:hypothetical protein
MKFRIYNGIVIGNEIIESGATIARGGIFTITIQRTMSYSGGMYSGKLVNLTTEEPDTYRGLTFRHYKRIEESNGRIDTDTVTLPDFAGYEWEKDKVLIFAEEKR